MNSEDPKVSILIPTYNQPILTRNAILSVIMQNFSDFEIIICDDSSNNLIEQLIKNEFLSEKRIKYFKNKNRLGATANWNKSIIISKGEYIKFLHHDDFFTEKNALNKFVNILDKNKKIDMAFSASNVISEDKIININRPSLNFVKEINKDFHNLFPENLVGAPSAVIFRKKCNILFDEKLKYVVDIDFYINFLRNNFKIGYISEALIGTNIGSHTLTSNCVNRETEIFEWTYLFNKINKDKKIRLKQWQFLKQLYIKYNIKELEELNEYSVDIDKYNKKILKFLLNNKISYLNILIKKVVGKF